MEIKATQGSGSGREMLLVDSHHCEIMGPRMPVPYPRILLEVTVPDSNLGTHLGPKPSNQVTQTQRLHLCPQKKDIHLSS